MVDRDGTLWVATGSQIVFLAKGAKQFQSTGIQAGKVLALTQAADGAIVFYDDHLKKLRAFRRDRGRIELLPDSRFARIRLCLIATAPCGSAAMD